MDIGAVIVVVLFVSFVIGALSLCVGMYIGHHIAEMEIRMLVSSAKTLETERDILADELRSRDRLRHHESIELN